MTHVLDSAGQIKQSGGISDHGGLTGLADNTHPQYGLVASPLSQFSATTSAQLAGVLSDETGTGLAVFATNPVLTTPNIGTPSAATLTNATGLPIATGVSGLGANVATFLATPSSANLLAAVTDETGTGAAVFATSPTLVTPALGTPSALVGTNITGTAAGLTAGAVTTNANLTGPITSVGNATSIASQTGTGTKFVVDTSPTLVTPILGVASATSLAVPALSTASGAMTITPAAGSNLNVALSTTGDLAVNTSQLYVDTSTGNVGIGTASPQSKLHVYSTGTASKPNLLIVNNYGTGGGGDLVGIGFEAGENASAHGPKGSLGYVRTGSYGTGDFVFLQNSTFDSSATTIANEVMRITNAGNVGIGTTAPGAKLHIVSTTATTNAQRNSLTLGANVTGAGVGAAGLGVGVLLQAESSTTVDTTQAAIATSWIVATHATRTARLALSAYDTSAREGLRIDADGTAARLGFYGVTATARQLLATGAGATVDNVITALQTLGLVKQS